MGKRGVKPGRNAERDNAIAAMYATGKTLAEVGVAFGIARERVRQIVSNLGLSRLDGGCAVRIFKSAHDRAEMMQAKAAKKELACSEKWGISLDQYRSIVGQYGNSSVPSSPFRKYISHRSNAAKRGIAWEFTFADWWRVWQESGHWEQRGLGHGLYVMARWGDAGSYTPANVYICTQSQNAKDSYLVHPAKKRMAKRAANGNCVRAKGFYYSPSRSKPNPYVVHFAGKHVGQYPTEELAREAYLMAASGRMPPRPKHAMRIPHTAKLNFEKAEAIRLDTRPMRTIAKEFGVSASQVCGIKSGKFWKSGASPTAA